MEHAQDFFPLCLAISLVTSLKNLGNLSRELVLRIRLGKSLESSVVCFVGCIPRRGVAVRIIRRPPALRECHVEVSRHHSLVEFILRKRVQLDFDAYLFKIRANIILNSSEGSITLEHDKVYLVLLAAVGVPTFRHIFF